MNRKSFIKIAIVSLGCPKNLADMEGILAYLKNIELVNEKDADIVFLNTCGFLKAARDEVFGNIKKLKKKKIILIGCMAGMFKKGDLKKYSQIYAIVTGTNYSKIQKILNDVSIGKKVYAVSAEPKIFESFAGKSLLTPQSYAYVKIAEGCDNRCSYCLIPYLKGKYRSRKLDEIFEEVKSLVKFGIKEIILVAQDCGCYGKDLYGTKSLANLLQKIEKISGDFWIRLLYIYPERINAELLKTIARSGKICKYLDIPLQHGDAEILKKMFRPSNTQNILAKIKKIRKTIPGIVFRTSLIVGFPGETEKNFKNLQNFVKKIEFDHVGVFEYSRERGTAAYKMRKQISASVKKIRRQKIMLMQQKISFKNNKKNIGKIVRTLIEKYDPEANIYVGRTGRFAPEIDGEVIVKSKIPLALNNFYDVKVTAAKQYDLFGEVVLR